MKKSVKFSKFDFYLILGTICVCIAAAIILNCVIGIGVVVGDSMNPTYKSGQIVLFDRTQKDYERDDIIIFYSDSLDRPLVKRIIAKEGDVVQIADGFVFVNGVKRHEQYNIVTKDGGCATEAVVVEKGMYFVLGDNRNNSIDSRNDKVGLVRIESIKGKVY